MRNRPIPLGVHAMAEPLLALLLIAAPFLFGFSDEGTATAVSILAGVALLALGMTTNWRLSVLNVVPLAVHAVLDIALGAFLVASPFLFGFSDESAPTIFFVLFGLTEILAALATRWSHEEDVGRVEQSGRGNRVEPADPAEGRFERQAARDRERAGS